MDKNCYESIFLSSPGTILKNSQGIKTKRLHISRLKTKNSLIRPGSDVVPEPCCAREIRSGTAVARCLNQSVILVLRTVAVYALRLQS